MARAWALDVRDQEGDDILIWDVARENFGTYICWLTEWQCLPLDRAAITMLATRHVHEV